MGFGRVGVESKKPLQVTCSGFFCCLTWIRTKTNRVRVCRTTVILSGKVVFVSLFRFACLGWQNYANLHNFQKNL